MAFEKPPTRCQDPVLPALPRQVANLLCNRQVLRVVLDGLAEVTLRTIRVAEVPVLPRPVAQLLCNRKGGERGVHAGARRRDEATHNACSFPLAPQPSLP